MQTCVSACLYYFFFFGSFFSIAKIMISIIFAPINSPMPMAVKIETFFHRESNQSLNIEQRTKPPPYSQKTKAMKREISSLKNLFRTGSKQISPRFGFLSEHHILSKCDEIEALQLSHSRSFSQSSE